MATPTHRLRSAIITGGIIITVLLGVLSGIYLLASFLAAYGIGSLQPLGATVTDHLVTTGHTIGLLVGTDALRFQFVWNSLTTAVLIGIVAPLVGTYLVHREMALIGETLAHTAFAGVAIGLFFAATTGWAAPILIPALIAGVLGAFIVQWLTQYTTTYGDVPIAIMLTGSFALGTIIISIGGGFSGLNIESFLFGNVGFVTADGAWMMGILAAIILTAILTYHKQLFFITFDQQAARVAQLNVDRYNTLLVILTAFVVVGAMQVLGIILVAALLVVPVAAAAHIAQDFGESIYLGVLFGELSVLIGLAAAFPLETPPGGTIVMTAIILYVAAIVLSPTRTTPLTA